jgi:hypothetical protein
LRKKYRRREKMSMLRTGASWGSAGHGIYVAA